MNSSLLRCLRPLCRIPLALPALLAVMLAACDTMEPKELPAAPMPAPPPVSMPGITDVYIVPMEDFPEQLAVQVAQSMALELNLSVKASLRLGHLDILRLPGSNQLISDDIVAKAQPVIRSLPRAGPNTYFLLLTTQDINSGSGATRFQFSAHQRETNTSVVSMARIFKYKNGQRYGDDQVSARLYKLVKRSIGEMRLGWQRSSSRLDIMYSPLMSVQDLDSIGLQHDPNRPQINLPVVPAPVGI